jgi:hypothetical protein
MAQAETDGFTKVRLARKVTGLRDDETITSREFALLFEAHHRAVCRTIERVWSRSSADSAWRRYRPHHRDYELTRYGALLLMLNSARIVSKSNRFAIVKLFGFMTEGARILEYLNGEIEAPRRRDD